MATTTVPASGRWLAYILRHGASDHGVWLWPGGWADLNNIVELRGRGCAVEHILRLASADSDNRFQVMFNQGWWIRATPPEERRHQSWWAYPPMPTMTMTAPPGLGEPDNIDNDDNSNYYYDDDGDGDQSWGEWSNAEEPAYVYPGGHYWTGAW